MFFKKKVSETHEPKPGTKLVEILLREGTVPVDTLLKALDEFRRLEPDQLIGEYLVEKGIICREQLEIVLIKQEASRNGGFEHSHVVKMMKMAQSTGKKVIDAADSITQSCQSITPFPNGTGPTQKP